MSSMHRWGCWAAALLAIIFFTAPRSSQALELDWSGQFWADFNYFHYNPDSGPAGVTPDARATAGGYYIPGGGSQDAVWQDLFLRVRPKIVVNDNIYIKSEWWLGDPVYGVFGNGAPYSLDQRQYYSSQSRGSVISAQRFWGEFLSDFGTFQVGRAPIHWGLGAVWNSGDKLWDRYNSTGDMVRWVAKFGAFSLIPAYIVYSNGNNIGGACNVGSSTTCVPVTGSGVVADVSVAFKFENPDEDFEAGVNLTARRGGGAQDTASGYIVPGVTTPTVGGINYLMWDLYGKKKFGKLSLGAEAPIVSNGTLGSSNYQTFAAVTEAGWRFSDTWETNFKFGYVPGQPSQATATVGNYQAFFLNPGYKLGMILFNYQPANFSGAQSQNNPSLSPLTLSSPYDAPITDALYLMGTQTFHADKWSFYGSVIYANALQTANGSGFFFNNWTRTMQNNATSGKSQGSSLGFEADLGSSFQWDEYLVFKLDLGLFLPGAFYSFSNTPTDNSVAPLFAGSARVGVNF